MNHDDDFIAQLEDYLDTFEGVVPLPASVRDEVQARLPTTRQVRASRGPERMLQMVSRISTPARVGMGMAAMLALVLLGAAALNVGRSAPEAGAAPPATEAPSLAPRTPEPSASAPASNGVAPLPRVADASCGPNLPDSCIPAGTYRLTGDDWPATISLEVPTGWWYYAASGLEGVLVENGDAPSGSGWGVTFHIVTDVSRDPCDFSAGRFPVEETASVDGLVAAMQSWPDFDVSEPTPIEVDGYAGQLVEVTSTRTEADCSGAIIWKTGGGTIPVDAYPMVGTSDQPRPGQFRILDVEGELVAIRTTDFGDASPWELGQGIEPDPERHVADQVELRAIVESIQITP